MTTQDEIKYKEAVEKVKKIKGFYSHLITYLVVCSIIIVLKIKKVDPGENIWHAFYVPFFWGIGLFFHALRVFDVFPFLGKKWEEKKIQELMDNENYKNQ
jgi:hypothetical protein